MMLKKPKEQVLEDIRKAAYANASQVNNLNLNIDTYQLQSALQNFVHLNGQYNLQHAIADAVFAGFAKLIENTYFEAEFEQDMGLRTNDLQKT